MNSNLVLPVQSVHCGTPVVFYEIKVNLILSLLLVLLNKLKTLNLADQSRLLVKVLLFEMLSLFFCEKVSVVGSVELKI